MTKPRPHAELIIAWANGAEIQYRMPESEKWTDTDNPAFVENCEYRVKPAREYPVSDMSNGQLHRAFIDGTGDDHHSWNPNGCRAVADAALKDAIDNGQVVTREEFNKVSAELKAAQQASHGLYRCANCNLIGSGSVIKVKA